jgi:hypothetical protein
MPNEYHNRKGPKNAEVKWLKASRVAAEMDVSFPTVKTWIAEGKLDAIRLSPNGEWRISRESLTTWQDSLRNRCSPRDDDAVAGS